MGALAVLDFAWPRTGDGKRTLQRAADRALASAWRVLRAPEPGAARFYAPGSATPADIGRMVAELDAGGAHGLRQDMLDVHLEIAGAAPGADCVAHYVVETGVDAAREDDFNAWYDAEHLPGLAAVPGVIRAVRYRRASGSPRYGAAYDLATQAAFASPAWLAVRATPWSSRVRPAFRDTTRTMYAVIVRAQDTTPGR